MSPLYDWPGDIFECQWVTNALNAGIQLNCLMSCSQTKLNRKVVHVKDHIVMALASEQWVIPN